MSPTHSSSQFLSVRKLQRQLSRAIARAQKRFDLQSAPRKAKNTRTLPDSASAKH